MKFINSLEQIQKENINAKFLALGANGKSYTASYSAKFQCMFFCFTLHSYASYSSHIYSFFNSYMFYVYLQ